MSSSFPPPYSRMSNDDRRDNLRETPRRIPGGGRWEEEGRGSCSSLFLPLTSRAGTIYKDYPRGHSEPGHKLTVGGEKGVTKELT